MSIFEQIRQPIAQEFHLFEQTFEKVLKTDNPLLKEVLSVILARKGKQLRPTLVLLTAKLCRGINDKTIQTAVILELLHTASLIHDDVVDSSDTRRGLPSINAKWNNKVAVLSGDYLLSLAMQLAANLRNTKILNIVSQLGQTLSNGELFQLSIKENGPTEKEYFTIIENKTAKLFSACCQAGAVSAGASIKQESSITSFGEELGICFQMQDDILDLSDSEELGKPTMSDIKDNKITLPLLIALNRAPENETQYIRGLMGQNIDLKAENDIKSFILRYGGIRYAQHKMQQHKQSALVALSNFKNNNITRSLQLLLDYSLNRLY